MVEQIAFMVVNIATIVLAYKIGYQIGSWVTHEAHKKAIEEVLGELNTEQEEGAKDE